jgi:hypothetical protein
VSEHWVADRRDGTAQVWCAPQLRRMQAPQHTRSRARPAAPPRAARRSRGSTVIMEDDPKPGALLGRMSFRRARAAQRLCAVSALRARVLTRACPAPRRASQKLQRRHRAAARRGGGGAAAAARRRERCATRRRLRTLFAHLPPQAVARARRRLRADARVSRVAGASAGTSVSDAEMAARLAGGQAAGGKHAAAQPAAGEPAGKRAKGDAARGAGGAGGGGGGAGGGGSAGGAAAGGFQKPAPFDGGRFFSAQQQTKK